MKSEAIYRGIRTEKGAMVTCDNKVLPNRADLRKHSTTEFDWGNSGAGCAQMSLAILADFCGDKMAMDLYQKFHLAIVQSLGSSQWEMNAAMLQTWVRNALKELKGEIAGNLI